MRISDWSSDVCSSDLVYADRARLAEAKRGFRMAQFPVAIVGGHDGASAQPPLKLLLRTAENIMRGLGHGKLHFCNGGNGNFRGQHFVKNAVISQIGEGKYLIAQPPAGPAAAPMPQPHPPPRHD